MSQAVLTAPPLSRRMACWTYEGVLMFGVVWIAGYLFGTLSQTRHAMDNRWALQAFLFVVFGIYFVWFWAKGQTLAMKTWHIRAVDARGQPLSQWRALARYALSWLWFLPPLFVTWVSGASAALGALLLLVWVPLYALSCRWQPGQQFPHDLLAGTRLIDTREPPAPKPAASDAPAS